MDNNSLFHDRYFLERLLGRGNFSEVWLAKDVKTDIRVAIKIYAPATGLDDNGLNVFAREFTLVVNANHKNLLKPLHYDTCDRKPYLVIPFCRKGSILKEVGKFNEERAWRLLRDVAAGLAWLHSMNPPVIHQDIKPDNVMIGDNDEFLITDFGVSTHLRSTLRKSMSAAFSSAGTIAYMAPERFGKDNTPIMANDIYSLGATVYEMLSGDTPFGDDGGLVQKKGAEVPDLKGDYSPQLKKVIAKCLQTNPWQRPTAEQLQTYAETALAGGIIRFVDEKTFFERYRVSVTIVAVVAVLSCVALGVWWLSARQQRARELARTELQHDCDSVKTMIDTFVTLSVERFAAGEARDEGYETAYIEAYDAIDKAIASVDTLAIRFNQSYKDKDKLLPMRDSVERKLYDAYMNFNAKVDLFSDDPEVSEEFKQRAAKIASVIDVGKFNKDSVVD